MMGEHQEHLELPRQAPSTRKAPNAAKVIRQIPSLRLMVLVFWVSMTGLIWFGPQRIILADRIIFGAWATVIAAAGLVALHFLKRQAIRDHRKATGCCVQCGYDLKATPERCPECGTAPSPQLRPDHFNSRLS